MLLSLIILFSVSTYAEDSVSRIMVFGDSLSAAYGIPAEYGWVQLLQERLDEKKYEIEVINASISGNTSGNGLNRIRKDLETHSPDLLILELGGNDGFNFFSLSVEERVLIGFDIFTGHVAFEVGAD